MNGDWENNENSDGIKSETPRWTLNIAGIVFIILNLDNVLMTTQLINVKI